VTALITFGACVVVVLALVGFVVLVGTLGLAVHDAHTTRMARVAAYTGGPLHLTIRHHRSTRG